MMNCTDFNPDIIPEETISQELLKQIESVHWCGTCSQCLYAYIMLAPHLSDQELITIFGEDLLEKKELAKELSSLAGLALSPRKNLFRIGRINKSLQRIQATRADRFLIKHYINESIRQMEDDFFEDYFNMSMT